jgi:3-hydroxyisobutyrate dehydrogenase
MAGGLSMQRIAVLGLGNMGAAMARRWLGQGFPVTVWNRTAAKAQALAEAGATVAGSAREAAASADVVVAMVEHDDASRPVWLGDDGAIAGLQPGAIAIESSTLSPKWITELGERVVASGGRFLDAPVGGAPPAVAAGTLTIFAGGDAGTLEAARPVLAAISARIEHVGGTGSGAMWKLINYMMAAAQIAGLAEVLTLAEKAGIARTRAAELIRHSVTASPAVLGKMERMVERRFDDPDAALRLIAKDERYAIDLARDFGAKPEILPVVSGIYHRAMDEGFGDLDMTAVIETIRRRSGLVS